jgi:hypothetical protein
MMAWICRYTSLRPDDVLELAPHKLDAFVDELFTILEAESKTGGGVK